VALAGTATDFTYVRSRRALRASSASGVALRGAGQPNMACNPLSRQRLTHYAARRRGRTLPGPPAFCICGRGTVSICVTRVNAARAVDRERRSRCSSRPQPTPTSGASAFRSLLLGGTFAVENGFAYTTPTYPG
jgi:hypothetical protein